VYLQRNLSPPPASFRTSGRPTPHDAGSEARWPIGKVASPFSPSIPFIAPIGDRSATFCQRKEVHKDERRWSRGLGISRVVYGWKVCGGAWKRCGGPIIRRFQIRIVMGPHAT